ncbi:DegT/DnrJ/EryC1/StrS family aminotransferase [Acidiferrimicrobium sp. IK]|uniref:DegT/DnrJ/EryC1/StrS family aminotransferase n=1 Tax=Acidiferrimicrobium sp. IK TaxID=2871700 RepID=UPI0021CB349E|nr:DegT/DnrJ/EryC1/StrS family aminotransferase [Acidiferrimicrobium sp. IK]MCU4184524.1 DegT/DnrJ/EryC1/StrS family aminotransferase [Acidiferrimicrobium sp. IK]
MTELRIPPARVVFSAADRARVLELVDRSLQTGSLTLGPVGAAFEKAFAASHGAEHAVATSSGTSALEIVIRGLGLTGEIIVPANTFFATAAAVTHAGAAPRFADVDHSTLSLSAATVEAALTAETTAVIVVHIGGLISPEMDAIAKLCQARGVALIEDAAHAHGSTLAGRHAGAWGQAATFSFYPTKVVAGAEGGMIVTADPDLAAEARIYRDQGKAGFHGGAHVRLGSAWRMSEVHAAVGLVHHDRLPDAVATRRRIARLYDKALAGLDGVSVLPEPAGAQGCYYKYIALLDPDVERDGLRGALRNDHGVALSGEVYARPLHHEPIFAEVPHGDLSGAEDVCARHICLPIHSDMTDEEAAVVVEALRDALPRARGLHQQ